MAYLKYERLVASATTSGAVVTTSVETFNGYLRQVTFERTTVPGTPFSTTLGWVLSGERTTSALFSIDGSTVTTIYRPAVTTVTSTGATSTGSAPIPLAHERITVTVTSGSTEGTRYGIFHFYVE